MTYIRYALVMYLCLMANADAQTTTYTFRKYFQSSDAYYQDGPFLKPIANALSWDLFAATTEKEFRPVYGELAKYNHKEVILYGYMFTLFQKDTLKHFILGPYAPTCPFHYHVNPNLKVKVIPEIPMNYSKEPVLIKGILRMLDDGNKDTYYILEHAALVN